MSVPPEILQQVSQWVEKAEHDLTTAEHTLTLLKDCPFDTVCFHAQQCAEKYLKGFLVSRSTDIRWRRVTRAIGNPSRVRRRKRRFN